MLFSGRELKHSTSQRSSERRCSTVTTFDMVCHPFFAGSPLQTWTVGFCGSEGGLPDYSPPIEYTHHAARISGRMMATFDAGGSWPWDILWDRCPVRRYVHAPFLHLGPAAMRRERRSQAEAKQSQGEAAKLAEEGARARDHHNTVMSLFFVQKKHA